MGQGGAQESGVQVRHIGRPKGWQTARLTLNDVTIALKGSKGNIALAAKALNTTSNVIERWIDRHADLNVIYANKTDVSATKGVDKLGELETIVRGPGDLPALIEASERAEEIMKQDREMMRMGLAAAGIKPETIAKLRSLDGLAVNAGRMVSATIDYTARLQIFAMTAIFEEMNYIRDNHLRKEGQDPMVTVFWQRAFNECAELLGKGHDRTMSSASALVALMKSQAKDKPGGSAKNKPGW